MGRKLKHRRPSDRELIESYIRGDLDADAIDAALGDFAWLAITSPHTALGQLAGKVWEEIGPALLRRRMKSLPGSVLEMIDLHGWPDSVPKRQRESLESEYKAELESRREADRQEILAIATKGNGNGEHPRPR